MDFLGGGELFYHLRKNGFLLESQCGVYFAEMILGKSLTFVVVLLCVTSIYLLLCSASQYLSSFLVTCMLFSVICVKGVSHSPLSLS